MALKARIPPHDTDTERSVLAAVLIDSEAVVKATEFLSPDSFYSKQHQEIFGGMVALYEKRQPIDVVTLTGWLKKNKKLALAGGASAITKLSNLLSTAANVESYAQLVREYYAKRRLIALAGEMSESAFDESSETRDVLDLAEQKVLAISQVHSQRAFIPLKDTLVESFDRLDELQKSGKDFRGLPTGFLDVDNLLAGLQPSNLLILAARPGIGKTAFSLNITQNIAVFNKKKIGFFSLEMSKEELVDRLLVSQADIDAWRLKTGRLDQQDFLKLSDAMGVLAEAQIFIDDTPGMNIYDMRTKARRLMTEQKIDMIVVDYLQLAHGKTTDNRTQEVGEISQGLKNIARELRVPVLALSQLNRAIESRGEKAPQLSDLRESGCLTGDTLIYMPESGRYEKIKDLEGKKGFSVLALNSNTYKLEKNEVSNAFCTGVKPVFELMTQLGRAIKATANHKFLTIDGWKRLDELDVGEKIVLPRELKSTNYKQSMKDEELALMAHLIGDGCTLPRHSVQYTTNELDLAELVAGFAKTIFGSKIKPRIKRERDWYQVYLPSTEKLARGKRNPIAQWFDNLGIWGLRSSEKFVSEEVFLQPDEKIALFLRHLWSTDGCINFREVKDSRQVSTVYYATSSNRLAYQVQSLLLRLGINARLKVVPQKNKGKDQHHIVISGKSDITCFIDKVGALSEKKQLISEKIKKHLSKIKENTNVDVLPKEIWKKIVVPHMASIGLSARKMQEKCGFSYSGTSLYKSSMSRTRADHVGKNIESDELLTLAQSDVYWDNISDIKALGKEKVYDLTVPKLSNFVANNIIVHNSIEQDADVVMFLYRKDEDIRESVTLKIAKHRNGPLGEVDLFFRGDRIKFYGLEKRAEAGMGG